MRVTSLFFGFAAFVAFVVAATVPGNVDLENSPTVDITKREVHTAQVDSFVHTRNNPVLTVEIGRQKTSFGKLNGSPMYGKVMDVIKLQCPHENGNCDNGRPSSFDVDSDNQKGRHRVTIEVLKAYWGDSADLWVLMIGTIAAAQEQASLNPSNCKFKKLGYCNIAQFISVIVPPRKGSPSGAPTTKMDVRFTSKYEMKNTVFDCVGLLKPVNTIVDILMPGYAKYAGMNFERNVLCQAPATTATTTDIEYADNLDLTTAATLKARDVDSIISADLFSTQAIDKSIRVDVGVVAQNIGNVGANYMYDMMYQALLKLCPGDSVMCTDLKVDIKVERLMDNGQLDPHGGNLRIKVERSYWGPDNPLRLLFIGTVAKILESGTLNGKACKTTNGHTVCSIPQEVNIKIPNGDQFFEARFLHTPQTRSTPPFQCLDQVKDIGSSVNIYKSYYETTLGRSLDPAVITCQKKKELTCAFGRCW